jgi:uncharacterized protein
MKSFLIIFFSLLIVASVAAQRSDDSVSTLRERVTDLTGTLTRSDIDELNARLAQFERETSNQIVVVIVPSLEGGSIEDYTLRVAEKNKVGKKGKDNGVLLVVAKDDHRIRIEVGYGLEGVLTDALSDQIIRRIITPRFRQNDYAGGIAAGVDAIMSATKGEFKGEPEQRNKSRGYSFLVTFILFLLFGVFSRLFTAGRRMTMGSRGYYTRGPWWFGGGGGFGGGGFGGGGFSGGGFSGGGGSFGGGGASGSW